MEQTDEGRAGSNLEAALSYARMGWAVFPCKVRGKAPATAHGCKDATKDEDQIRAWWAANPAYNVAVACGSKSGGLVVIDLDMDEESGENGLATLFDWEVEHGELPKTVTAVTGRGGRHPYFKCAGEVRNSANPALGIDVRGEGGYVMAAPSVHPNGRAYEWSASPLDWRVEHADGRMMEFIEFARPKGSPGKASASAAAAGGARFGLPAIILAGQRNDTIFRSVASMQALGPADTDIRAAAHAANEERCVPPLPRADVDAIVDGVLARYGKGVTRQLRRLDRKGEPTGTVRCDKVWPRS